MYVQSKLNSEITHASVVTFTAASPSGSPFTATDAAVTSEFCFNAPSFESYVISVAPIEWRILIQVLGMQMDDYMKAQGSEDRAECQKRILNVLKRVNEKAQLFLPQSFPYIIPPTDSYRALNAMTGNWCYVLTQQLTCLFMNVPMVADTLKIEETSIQPQINADWMLSNNLPALLETGNT